MKEKKKPKKKKPQTKQKIIRLDRPNFAVIKLNLRERC